MRINKALFGLAAMGVLLLAAAPADAFTCTPKAIHDKSTYTRSVWDWLNSSASDDASPTAMQSKLDKIWDGSGDCNGDEDMSKFPDQTPIELITTHFYGDMMTVAFEVGAKQYKEARRHYDDWVEADKLIRERPSAFEDSVVADDQRQRGRMLQFNTQLTKLGYPPSKKD